MIINKSVKIKDVHLLNIFYPDYETKDCLLFDKENNIIYTGPTRKNLLEYLKNNTKSFINTVGPMYDYDFDNREVLIEFINFKYSKKLKEDRIHVLLEMPDEEFYRLIKTVWVSGKWGSLEKTDTSIFDLFKVFGKSRSEALKTYFSLLEFYSSSMIESSILTFIEKSLNLEEVNASPYYIRLLKDFRERNDNSKIRNILYYYKTALSQEKKDLKMAWLIMSF